MKPLISIITVVFNASKTLENTILAVLDQTYKNIEYIIIDGGSTDGTIEIIKKYEDKIDFWISEYDHGIYDAMNKALRYVHGEWVHYLNSDDVYFSSNTLEMITPFLQNNTRYDVVHGLMKTRRRDGSLKTIQSARFYPQIALYHYCPIQQPAAFVKYKTLLRYQFDASLKIAADYKLWIHLLRNGTKVRFVSQVITLFADGGASSNIKERNKEVIRIFQEMHIPKIIIILLHFSMFAVVLLRKHRS